MTGCVCAEPGWCERHGVRKTPHWHMLCRTRQDYFDLWESGHGPDQEPIVRTDQAPVIQGPGTELHKILLRLRVVPTSGCGCAKFMTKMNEWGPAGCRQHMDEILDHLRHQAAKHNIPFVTGIVRQAVKLAIRRSELLTIALRSIQGKKL